MSGDTTRIRIAVACSESPGRIDAIHDASLFLADALRSRAHVEAVDLQLRRPDGRWAVVGDATTGSHDSLDRAAAGYDLLLLQYNPFLYGRWGATPWLLADIGRLRLRRRRPHIMLVVHEPYVPMIGWRWTLMGLWQRLQLALLRGLADTVFASIELWAERFGGWRKREAHHLPVGSNLPDRRASRSEARAKLGARDETVVVATLANGRSTRLPELVVDSVRRLAEDGRDVVLLDLGADPPALTGLPSQLVVRRPGELDTDALADALSAADLFLAPFADGVSTRRGSVMAALQHGIAVVATDGPLTDPTLRDSGGALRLVPVERGDLFADAVSDLAADAVRRADVGRRGRRLYERSFDWPVIADRVLLAAGAVRS